MEYWWHSHGFSGIAIDQGSPYHESRAAAVLQATMVPHVRRDAQPDEGQTWYNKFLASYSFRVALLIRDQVSV